MKRAIAGAILTAALAAPAGAVEVRECDYAASVQSIAEPWERNTRAFYRGMVRVALLDTGGEPVCCSQHLLILGADMQDPAGGRFCRVVGDREQMGFMSIDFARLRTSYDRARGLLIEFAYQRYGDGIRNHGGMGRVRVNLERGTVAPE